MEGGGGPWIPSPRWAERASALALEDPGPQGGQARAWAGVWGTSHPYTDPVPQPYLPLAPRPPLLSACLPVAGSCGKRRVRAGNHRGSAGCTRPLSHPHPASEEGEEAASGATLGPPEGSAGLPGERQLIPGGGGKDAYRLASGCGLCSRGSWRQQGQKLRHREFRGAPGCAHPHLTLASLPRRAGSRGDTGVTHGHTEPAHSTPMLSSPEGQGFAPGPTGVTRQPLGPWD